MSNEAEDLTDESEDEQAVEAEEVDIKGHQFLPKGWFVQSYYSDGVHHDYDGNRWNLDISPAATNDVIEDDIDDSEVTISVHDEALTSLDISGGNDVSPFIQEYIEQNGLREHNTFIQMGYDSALQMACEELIQRGIKAVREREDESKTTAQIGDETQEVEGINPENYDMRDSWFDWIDKE